MKGTFYILLLFSCTYGLSWAQNPDSTLVTLNFENSTIQNAIGSLSGSTHINFSYQSNLPGLQKKISNRFYNQPLKLVLEVLLNNSGLSYRVYAGQIIISATAQPITGKILIEGKLCSASTHEVIPFAGIELKVAHKGTISDISGYFRMEINGEHSLDTLWISSINYHPIKIPIKTFSFPGMHTFFMNERTIDLPGLDVVAQKGKTERLGNHRWFGSGSFYLDTHGQQTALHIENEKQSKGNLVSVGFYLSKRGNTDAPFRVHIYLADSVTGKPGIEILPEMIIIKPNQGKGWCKVNLSRYHIDFPSNGLFVAIEGIFPGDYDFFYDDGSESYTGKEEDLTDDFEGETISYGQQIGYSGGSENKTWHYSIDGNWFQLKKKHFNAMISAEINFTKTKGKHGFLGLFGRKKNKQDTKNIEI
jgi:hypothetical protein